MVASSKICSRVLFVSVIIILMVTVAMSHPTNCSDHEHHGPPPPPPFGGPGNDSVGFIGQQSNMSNFGAFAEEIAQHEGVMPAISAGTKPASIASKVVLATIIAIALAVILSR
ncbi:hypothetical protein F4805DRAFT_460549 [Annulohypoxylon moriforme]|nr:hypothetical protein F4805DRAFT_460549 [Annulohypoxylon moriforme]